MKRLSSFRRSTAYQRVRAPINKAVRIGLGYAGGALHTVTGMGRHPSFLITGTQKAGTTALHQYLTKHPQLVSAQQKELHYFSFNYHRGALWYKGLFPARLAPDQHTFEASPSYLYHPAAAARIHAYDPTIKQIVILRDPVERAFSAWSVLHWYKEGFADFDAMARDAIARDGTFYHNGRNGGGGFIHRGLYALQLERYFALFPRDQFLILESRALKGDPIGVLMQIEGFLGLTPHDWSRETFAPVNVTPPSIDVLKPETRALLRAYYAPHNARLYDLLGVDYGWENAL